MAALTWLFRGRMPASPLRGWVLSLFPAASFIILLREYINLSEPYISLSYPWISTLNLNFSIYFDAFSALFGLLITGIGTLIIIYAGYYFADDTHANRFFSYLALFMGMMLGVVLAGDLFTLFLFWEGTSITSFLLVAYKYNYEASRRGALKALMITGGGGIAMLAGFLFLHYVVGASDFDTLLAAGDIARASDYYIVILGLIAFGAFTKSAQVPAHIWLPEAMSAPTPASAYLHSATMVKAGIYLLARLHPTLGQTETWFWLLSIVGLITMFTGAYLGTKQDDLKALLAYSTISQLGILVMLIGQDTEIAFKALIIGIVAHALYKSALFMLTGIIDLQTGTRELSRFGGLRHAMPATFVLMAIASLSLAGLPPLFGFLAKETLLATAVHPSLPLWISWVFAGIIVVAAGLKLVQAGLISLDVFTGLSKDTSIKGQEAPWGMLVAPAVPALLSLGLGLLPEPKALAEFFGFAAAAVYGDNVKVSFALWTGLNIPVFLSAAAIGLGAVLYWRRSQLIALQHRFNSSFNRVYDAFLNGVDGAANGVTRLQTGQLRLYLRIILLSAFSLILILGGIQWPGEIAVGRSFDQLRLEFDIIRLLALFAIVGAAAASVFIKRDFFAVLALSASGLSVALVMAVEPAPDVALVQIVVDILATLVLVLALSRLPRKQRQSSQLDNHERSYLNWLVAMAGGIVMTLMSYQALNSRPRESLVTPYFEANAKKLTGASDIVGAIIVDFRALDTLIEIAVFSLAGLGIYTLLRFSARLHGKQRDVANRAPQPQLNLIPTEGHVSSIYLRKITDLLLPFALMVSLIHIIYGHDQPGDGFTAGVIASLAIGVQYVVNGFQATRRKLWWLRPKRFIAAGILLVVISGALGALISGAFLAPVDYGAMLRLPLPQGVKLSSGFIFEIAIALAVLGSVTLMLDTLGHPEIDVEAMMDEGLTDNSSLEVN